jgi:hypothetical protein
MSTGSRGRYLRQSIAGEPAPSQIAAANPEGLVAHPPRRTVRVMMCQPRTGEGLQPTGRFPEASGSPSCAFGLAEHLLSQGPYGSATPIG